LSQRQDCSARAKNFAGAEGAEAFQQFQAGCWAQFCGAVDQQGARGSRRVRDRVALLARAAARRRFPPAARRALHDGCAWAILPVALRPCLDRAAAWRRAHPAAGPCARRRPGTMRMWISVSISGWNSARCGTPSSAATSGMTRASAPQRCSTSMNTPGHRASARARLLPHAFGYQRIRLAGFDHGPQQRHRLIRDAEAQRCEARSETRYAQDAYRVFGECGRHMPQDARFQIGAATAGSMMVPSSSCAMALTVRSRRCRSSSSGHLGAGVKAEAVIAASALALGAGRGRAPPASADAGTPGSPCPRDDSPPRSCLPAWRRRPRSPAHPPAGQAARRALRRPQDSVSLHDVSVWCRHRAPRLARCPRC